MSVVILSGFLAGVACGLAGLHAGFGGWENALSLRREVRSGRNCAIHEKWEQGEETVAVFCCRAAGGPGSLDLGEQREKRRSVYPVWRLKGKRSQKAPAKGFSSNLTV